MNVTPALPALSGGPRVGGTLKDLASPSREMVWRHLRALRHQPPGSAREEDRARVFGAALEQSQQLFAAAASVDYASRPILVFYGVSQAGRAIAACSTAAKDGWQLKGHGIGVPKLDKRPELPGLTIRDNGNGSFTQLAPLLNSGSLPDGASLGQIWLTIPELAGTPLGSIGVDYRPTLRLDHLSVHGNQEVSSWISGMPMRFAGHYTEDEFATFCRSYPTLLGFTGLPVSGQQPIIDEEQQSVRLARAWTLPAGDDPGKFHSRLTRPYLGDDDRYIFPSIGGDAQALHPLLAWWAILFALSMLARYQPDTWTYYLDVDKSAYAVPLEALLDRALPTCPELVLHAIRSVS